MRPLRLGVAEGTRASPPVVGIARLRVIDIVGAAGVEDRLAQIPGAIARGRDIDDILLLAVLQRPLDRRDDGSLVEIGLAPQIVGIDEVAVVGHIDALVRGADETTDRVFGIDIAVIIDDLDRGQADVRRDPDDADPIAGGRDSARDMRAVIGGRGLPGARRGVRAALVGAADRHAGIDIRREVDLASATPGATTPLVTELRASTPHTDLISVSLVDPALGWSVSAPFDPAQQDRISIAAFASDADRTTTSLVVTRADYEQVSADRVLVREAEVWTRAEFDRRACDPATWPSPS